MTEYYNGTPGDDSYNYNGPDSLIAYGKGGNDFIWGNNGDDFLNGDEGHDTLRGWNGNDWLYGGTGNDQLYGEAGDDFLNGYLGRYSGESDILTGGTGADVFGLGYNGSYSEIGYLGEGFATITDFNQFEGDKIRLGGDKSFYSLTQTSEFSTTGGVDTVIKYNSDVIGVIQNTIGLNLDSSYFSFVGGHFS